MSNNAASLGNLSQMTGMSPAELARRAEGLVDAKTGKIAALSALDAALVANTSTAGKSAADAFAAMGAATANPHAIEEPSHVFTHGAPQGGYAPEPPAPPSIGGPLALLEKSAKSGASRMSGFCGGCTPPAPPPPAEVLVVSPEGGGSAPAAGGCGPDQPATVLATSDTTAPFVATPAPPAPPAATPGVPVRTQRSPLSNAAQALQGRMRGFEAGSAAPPGAGGRVGGPPASDQASLQGDLDANSRNMQFELIKNEIQKMTQLQNAVSNTLAAMHEQAMTAIRNAKA